MSQITNNLMYGSELGAIKMELMAAMILQFNMRIGIQVG
jgi:hypothetical protein